MDKIVSKIAGLGIPGLVLVFIMSTSGFAGAAAFTVALASLGGPLGMLGGVATLGILLLISQALTEFGFERVFHAVLDRLLHQGHTKTEIRTKIAKYPISADLKKKLSELLKTKKTRSYLKI